ncbi:hypothetical protein KKC94_04420 [Patescibacteria group bacterium]|nr:hypothetical protein [Patescibacteria group bacterium]
MTKKVLIGAIAVLIVVLVGGFLYFNNSSILQGSVRNIRPQQTNVNTHDVVQTELTSHSIRIENLSVNDHIIETNETDQPLSRLRITNDTNESIEFTRLRFNLNAGETNQVDNLGFYDVSGNPIMENLRIITPEYTMAREPELPSNPNNSPVSTLGISFSPDELSLAPGESVIIKLVADFTRAFGNSASHDPITATLVPEWTMTYPTQHTVEYSEESPITEIIRSAYY